VGDLFPIEKAAIGHRLTDLEVSKGRPRQLRVLPRSSSEWH
jgi:hypothetical protein